ncbi:MAG: BREX-1 system adenine-specific DNA-methyltransferase PglX [Deltaproteobacteria bacterium]|nr:BREX-1 system adenine-specific DNA-methyltransferase PglX [Deltaproteobacteria bacterium]
MDTGLLKKFAQSARRQLMEQVSVQIDRVLKTDSGELRERAKAIEELKRQIATSSKQAVIERVAYTWFNRFCALRFMDVNGYTKVRVVSPTEGFTLPEILAEAKQGHIDETIRSAVNEKNVSDLLTGRVSSRDAQSEVYQQLLVAACNYYHSVMPFLFERIDDYTELLMPEDLLSDSSILTATREALTFDACKDVEVIGWLYQFYISERKDEVMARKSAVPTEDIPAVTQLFTPHWIVSYLVENSLGRLWLLNRPNSRLREHMPYYIEGEPETDFLKITKPEEIRLCDPACGSGHMLTYAFDLLTLIYEEEGYAPTEIPALILRHNLYGLEICPRAAQLAQLALIFKAREKSRRFFESEHIVRPNIIELCNVCFTENELKDYVKELDLGALFDQPVIDLLHQFKEAKNFGSLIQPCLAEQAIADVRRAIEAKDVGGQLFLHDTHIKVQRVLAQAEALTQRYHVVVANPPYMGRNAMNAQMRVHADEAFPNAKLDLYAMFIERNRQLAVRGGFFAMITMHSWMFLGSFKALRSSLVAEESLRGALHLGPRAFDSIGGEVVQTVAFVFQHFPSYDSAATILRLVDGGSEREKVELLISTLANPKSPLRYTTKPGSFSDFPDSVFGYWLSNRAREAFKNGKPLASIAKPRQGLATTNNSMFLRFWHEAPIGNVKFDSADMKECVSSRARWYPVNKGGTFRRWYGNHDYLVDFSNGGKAICDYIDNTPGVRVKSSGRVINREFYFREGITWSSLGTSFLAMRYSPPGRIFETKCSTCFFESHETLLETLGFTNSVLVNPYIAILAPTLDFHEGPVGSLPIICTGREEIPHNVKQCIALARADWDNFETSWDFRDQPLLRPGLKGATLEESWRNWEAQSTAAIRQMQELETENNRLFITAYGLEGELQPEVPEDQITLARAEVKKDMAAFLSYAVGCMLGRYSLDKPGLILANKGETLEDYLKIIFKPTFTPDKDNVIPIVDGDWFTDDIVARFKEFLRITFGDEHYQENIDFVETAIGKDLRNYFFKDFYKDHIKTYKKRPIYWMFTSPNSSFNALIYMHRYRPDTVSVVLNDYLREYRTKLEAYKASQEQVSISAASTAGEKTKALKEIEKLRKVIQELDAYERDILYPLAAQQLAIDLDDGVKVNYVKFGRALKKIPGLDETEE